MPRVERGELDLTFGILPLPEGPFEAVELLRDPYVLIVPPDSPLAAAQGAPDLRELADMPLIGFRQCRSVEQVEDRLRERGIEPRIVFRSDDNGTVQALVAAGVGVALVPRLTIEPSDQSIVVVDLENSLPPRRIAIVWHRDRYRSPATCMFIEAARILCEELERGLGQAAVPR